MNTEIPHIELAPIPTLSDFALEIFFLIRINKKNTFQSLHITLYSDYKNQKFEIGVYRVYIFDIRRDCKLVDTCHITASCWDDWLRSDYKIKFQLRLECDTDWNVIQ